MLLISFPCRYIMWHYIHSSVHRGMVSTHIMLDVIFMVNGSQDVRFPVAKGVATIPNSKTRPKNNKITTK